MKWQALGALFLWLSGEARASLWQDLWVTKDAQGQKAMAEKKYKKAAKLFKRPDWKAAALYASGQYQKAAQLFHAQQSAQGFYNEGNARMQLHDYPKAIIAYDASLRLNPHDDDALYNKALAQKLLAQQSQNAPQKNPDTQKSNAPQEKKKQASTTAPNQDASKKQSQDARASRAQSMMKNPKQAPSKNPSSASTKEAKERWLQLIQEDPQELLRQKFLRDHLKRQQGDE